MRRVFLLLPLLLIAITANGQAEPEAPVDTPEQVLVVGEHPGPRLWRVTADDHVLWIMGTPGVLPKGMNWRSHEVERVIAQSQAMLAGVNVDTDIGFFTKITLLPSLMKARKNPDKQQLSDVVPADLYQRWLPLKAQYLGSNKAVESWRPIFAAQKLHAAAIEKAGLTGRSVWWEDIQKLARKHKLANATPKLHVEIEKPRASLKEFRKTPMQDIECFRGTLDRVENDMETMRLRANAWAVGDIEALRRLPYTDVLTTCINAVLSTTSAQQQGWQNLPTRLADAWVDAAEASLRKNASTFAVLPINEILKPDGWVAALVARGYTLEVPETE